MIKELPEEIQEALNQRFLSICERSSKMFPGLENEEIFNSFQPKRSKREDSSFLCAKCELPFDPSDWQNDVCDKCLYKR